MDFFFGKALRGHRRPRFVRSFLFGVRPVFRACSFLIGVRAEGLLQGCGECGNFSEIFLAPQAPGIFRPQPFSNEESPFFSFFAGPPSAPPGREKKSEKSFRKVLTGRYGLSFMEVFLASENGAAFFESYSVRLGGSFEPVNPLNNNCATAFLPWQT
ncbi:MAG: hypothetical protein JJU00_09750 [Opitutales bacterium]|nr:hypothetical protein [Opitutales bacterium]